MKKSLLSISYLLLFSGVLASCSGGQESEIAKNIGMKISGGVVVLPNDTLNTCVSGGVTGPRVRMRGQIAWKGVSGGTRLLPLTIMLQFNDPRLSAAFSGAITVENSGTESMAFIFTASDGSAVATDYIPASDSLTYSTTLCFFDFGDLPKPKTALTGSSKLEVPVTVIMSGIVRDDSGLNDQPFTKEARATITYVAGSTPVD